MGRRNTWWVEYSFSYLFWDNAEKKWEPWEDFDADRFQCLKKDIRKEVEQRVREDLSSEQFKDLKITITDCYITTDVEV